MGFADKLGELLRRGQKVEISQPAKSEPIQDTVAKSANDSVTADNTQDANAARAAHINNPVPFASKPPEINSASLNQAPDTKSTA